jgi:hypothetical protein
MKIETLDGGNFRITSNAGNSYLLTHEALAALPQTPGELFRALAAFHGRNEAITLDDLVSRDIVCPDPNQRWGGDEVLLFKDVASQDENRIEEAIDFALSFAGYDEDDFTLPNAYVCDGEGWGVFSNGVMTGFFETESAARAAAAPGDVIQEATGWYISRDDRGPEAGSCSSETLAAFVDEADARAECEKINRANRPTPTLVILPRGVKFNGFEDLGTGRGTDRLFKVFVSFNDEDFEGRGWGETSYGRSGDGGLWHALEDAVREAGFPDWTIKNSSIRDA